MTTTTQTQTSNNNAVDGANANQGGANSQDGGAAAANNGANQNANHNAGGANQAGAEDYQKKFSESTTENQRIMAILKKNGIDPKTGERAQQQDDYGNDSASGSQFFTDTDLEAAFPSYNTINLSTNYRALIADFYYPDGSTGFTVSSIS